MPRHALVVVVAPPVRQGRVEVEVQIHTAGLAENLAILVPPLRIASVGTAF